MNSGMFLVNLLKIDVSARELMRDSPEYRSHFMEWRNQREVTVQVVDDLALKMKNIHQVSNGVKGTGAIVSIAGGVASVIGIALKWAGHETASKVIRDANIAQVIGSVATGLASLAEFGLTRKVEMEVKTVLQRDIELMKVINKWIQRSVRFDSVVKEVFGYDIQSQLLFDVVKICYYNLQLVCSATETIDSVIAALEKQFEDSKISELPEKVYISVLNIMEKISENPRLIKPLKKVCYTLLNNNTLLDIVLTGMKLNHLVQVLFKFDLISNVLAAFGLPAATYASEIPRLASNTIGIALNVVTAIFAAKNLQKGSEYSEKLKDLAFVLKTELKQFDAEYRRICN